MSRLVIELLSDGGALMASVSRWGLTSLVSLPFAGITYVGVAGYGEGRLLAFYAAAVDPRRHACLVSGYFESRQRTWQEPIYRNVWGLLREFGDAEVTTLIAPRGLVVEYSEAPAVQGRPPIQRGRRGGAVACSLHTHAFAAVDAEFRRIEKLLPPDFQHRQLIAGTDGKTIGPGSTEALQTFARMLGIQSDMKLSNTPPIDQRKRSDPASRQQRQVLELERHVQRLVRASELPRERYFSLNPATGPRALESFEARLPRLLQYLWEEVLGKFDDHLLAPRPRSRKIYDKEKWVGDDVVLDVFPNVFAWGVLLLPRISNRVRNGPSLSVNTVATVCRYISSRETQLTTTWRPASPSAASSCSYPTIPIAARTASKYSFMFTVEWEMP
jgi:hypothetical protein